MKKIYFLPLLFLFLLSLAACGSSSTPPSDATEPKDSKDIVSYQAALTTEELEQAEAVAKDYYKGTVQQVESLEVAPDDDPFYEEKEPGNVIMFQGKDTQSGAMRRIVLERTESEAWEVTNEGY